MTVPNVPNSDPETKLEAAPRDSRVVVRVYALSDVGRAREHNEDSFLVADLEGGQPLDFSIGYHEVTADSHGLLFLVADGMGGAASGELASSMASSVVLERLTALWSDSIPTVELFTQALRDATISANHQIHQHARENPEHRGMGTTATIAGLLGDHLYIVQVGDSRAYLVRDGKAGQLTKDQSLMQRLVEAGEITQEEAERSERRNIILQALGPEAQIVVDLTYQRLQRGDILVLCSDGLSGLVRAEEIAAAAQDEPDVRVICGNLVKWANERGGPDNVTVIAARFDGEGLNPLDLSEEFGYRPFPLEGTLWHQLQELEQAEAAKLSESARQTDEMPQFDLPLSSTSAGPHRVSEKNENHSYGTSENGKVSEVNDLNQSSVAKSDAGASDSANPRIVERQRALQPIFALLGVIAVAALTWTAWRWFGN